MYRKKFFFILLTTAICSMFFIFLGYFFSGKNAFEGVSTTKLFYDHRNIAKHINGNKILIISGSSTLYGVDTERMSKELKCPTINFGVSTAYRLDYLFFDAKKSINDNDIVILPIEYSLYCEEKYSIDRLLAIWQDQEYFNQIPLRDKLYILYSIPINVEFKLFMKSVGLDEKKVESFHLNSTGDYIDNIGLKKNAFKYAEAFDENKFYLDENTKTTIIDFINYCRNKNVKIFVTYPPFYNKQKYFEGYNLEQINKINDFWKKQDVTIIGNYDDFIYTDINVFHDYVYHLNNKGKEERTEQLIELLKPYLGTN